MADNQESLLPSPPSSSSPGDNGSIVPRRKRWAPKVKTGCVTCRVRRVKCDETKPQCVRCTAYGYVCDGYVTAAPAGASKAVQARVVRKSSEGSSSPDYLDNVLERRLVPPDWDFMESCRFYIEAVLPLRQRELDYAHRGPLNLETRYRPGFLLAMTAQHISLLGIAANTLPHPTHLTSISQLWAKFHAYMVHNIQDINNYLQGASPYNRVLALLRITDVLSVELSLLGTTWRAHNAGFLALLNMDDAVSRKLPTSNGLESAKQFQIITAVVANTTSPASDQIDEIYKFTEDELASIFSKELYGELPCPTTLFLELIRITNLRRLVLSGASYNSIILPALNEIIDRIDGFDPEKWDEPYGVPEQPEFVLMARIFKSSITLYAVLSLPPPPFFSTAEALEAWAMRRTELRDELMRQMREAYAMLRSKAALSWPVAVAGVAVADSTPEDQAFVLRVFTVEEGATGDSFYVPMFYRDKLTKFWASGKLGWEACFDEPFAPMA